MQEQAIYVKLQQKFELAGVTWKKVLQLHWQKHFNTKSPILAFLF